MAAAPLPNLTGGAGGAAGASNAASNMRAAFDSTGWTVATGGSKAGAPADVPWMMLVVGAVVGLAVWKLA